MAGAKPAVHVVQLKPIVVPKSLQDGAKFVKWDDDPGQATPVTLRVDKNGFFLYWTDQNKETEFLEISSIRDTRTGKYARTPRDPKLQYHTNIGSQDTPIEEKTVTIVHGSDFVNPTFINFCCDRRETAKEWTDELLKMAYNLLALNASATTMLAKAHAKITLSTDKDGKIPVKNIVKVFAAQNREDKKRVEKALEMTGLQCGKNDMICPSKFTFEVFFNFYKHLTGRTEAEKIFDELCNSGNTNGKRKSYMTREQLVNFLNQEQRDPRLNEILYPYVTNERAQDIINQYEMHKGNALKGHLSFDGFLRYIMSDDNAIVAPEKFDLNLDMNQPLPHYFINSSHNTYLTGHQLTGRSSVEIYRQCLLAGCRCVELDCWNNGRTSEDEPIITHGFTVVTEVNFKDVIEAIAESAFKTSEYPVILSFENHCSPKIQAKMAMYCRKIFGDLLLSEPLPSHPIVPVQPLPSPNQLLRKIIIKNKKKHYHHRGSSNSNNGFSETKGTGASGGTSTTSGGAVPVSDAKNEISSGPRLQKTNSRDSQSEGATVNVSGTETVGTILAPNGDIGDSDSESASEDDGIQNERKEITDGFSEADTSVRESEAGAEMSALVNYIQPVHFHSFEVSEKRNRSYEISSFVETTATNLLKEHPVDFVNYNKRQLSRIYPRGTRVDSSNYMPQVYWNAGCQLVALNFQTLDLAMQLNLGIFEFNGRSGFLLKPDFMRRNDRKFDPFAESTVDGIIAGSLSVKIISGHFLSDKRVSTYVEVESYGLPADTVRKRFKTKVVPNNGINPVYDEEPFVFKKVVLPDLAVIRIVVCEEGGKIIGHRILPVVGLRPGYRHIALRNESGQPLTLPTLFVYITVKDYVPDKLSGIADALVNPIKYQSELEKRAQQLSCLTDDFDESSEASDGDPKRPKSDRTPIKNSNSLDPSRNKTVKPASSLDSSGSVSMGKDDIPSSFTSHGHPSLSSSPLSSEGASAMDKEMPLRKDSKKTLTSKIGISDSHCGDGASTTYEFPKHLFVAESLDKIKENKAVQIIMAKLEKELQSVKKRHTKLRSKTSDSLKREEEKLEKQKLKSCKSSSKLRKISATINEASSAKKPAEVVPSEPQQETKLLELQRTHSEALLSLCQDQCKAEMEIRKKYQDQLYETIEKCMQASQAAQLKLLDEFHESHKDEVKKKSNLQSAEEIRELKKNFSDKNERARMKREIQTKHINVAVCELQRLEEYYQAKKKELEHEHEEVHKAFEEDKEKALERLESLLDEEIAKIQETVLTSTPANKSPSTQQEMTAL